MAVLIKPIQRVNPQEPDAPKKWYAVQVTTAQVDETQVAMDIAEETTLNPSEAMMALRQLRKIVLRRLLAGESVKLGNWGSFNLTLSCSPADTREALTANNIKKVNLNFLPDEEFRADLQKATFTWVDKLMGADAAAEEETETGEETGESGGGSQGGGTQGGTGSGGSGEE